jgi:hypothetical protein
MEAIKNYADKDEIQTHAGKAHWNRQSNALTTRPPWHIWCWRVLNICRIKKNGGHLVVSDAGDSWIFVELRKMEAIKSYADKDEIQTHVGNAHWISQSNTLTTRPPYHMWFWW